MTQLNSQVAVASSQSPVAGNLQPVTGNLPATNTIRTIRWPCNYNNKMGCTGFVHIDLPPEQKPLISELDTIMVKIVTADSSHSPVIVNLFDILFLPLKKMTGLITISSHGMEAMEFANFMIKKYPERVTLDTELAVYYYKKVL
jgi:hypothetical protein